MIVWKADRINEGECLVIGLKETTGSVIEVSCYAGYLITEKSGHNNLKYTTCVSLNNQSAFTPFEVIITGPTRNAQLLCYCNEGEIPPQTFITNTQLMNSLCGGLL